VAESVTLYRDGGFFWCDVFLSSFYPVLYPPPQYDTAAHPSRTSYKSLEYLLRYARSSRIPEEI